MRAILAALLLFGLVSTGCTPFYLPKLTKRGREVAVYDDAAQAPASCRVLQFVTVEDGNGDYGKGYIYDGTEDGAMVRLRNLAASMHGNAVAVVHDDEMVCFGCNYSPVWVRAHVLRCAAAPRPD